jgi:tripartite-type tricarboxylate transporter receptor subunit TctC
MRLPRREFLRVGAAAVALSALPRRHAWALDYPTRPVHIVVGFAAGANPDIIARLLAQPLSVRLGQQFIVDDRPGAASNIGTEIVAHALPDGYTLLAVVSTNTINATLYDNPNFDFARDVVPVGGTVRLPSVMAVTPSLPTKSVPEFVAYAKASPGAVTMASAGTGSASHVIGELFQVMTGVRMLHVPYSASYMPDLLSGQVQMVFSPIAQLVEFVRDGKMRALAVTGSIRSEALPNVPALAEFVPGYEAYIWDGIGAPRGTAAGIIDKLNEAINVCLADPTMKMRLANLGAEPMPMAPAEFGRFIADETDKWAKVIKFANIKPE